MTTLWKRLLYFVGILFLLIFDLSVDYEEMGEKVLEVVKNQGLGNCVCLTLMEYNGVYTIGGRNLYTGLERGVLVTVLFLTLMGGFCLRSSIFLGQWKIMKDEYVKFFELFEFLRVS